FLILAWLMVATLLWMEWSKEKTAPAAATPDATAQLALPQAGAVPEAPVVAGNAAVPTAPAVPGAEGPSSSALPAAGVVTVETDVLRLLVSGGSVLKAELLHYPQTRDEGSAPVVLFDNSVATFYAAQSGWASGSDPAPNHVSGFVPETAQSSYTLEAGASELVVPFIWRG